MGTSPNKFGNHEHFKINVEGSNRWDWKKRQRGQFVVVGISDTETDVSS